jgi:O-antigen/teichoic acid export membrane protein
MDLNAAINGISKVLSSVGTVLVLYFGGGIVGAALWFLAIGLIGIAAHIVVSGSLLKQFLDVSIDRRLIKPLLKFGAGLAFSAVAAVLLANLEKLLVGRFISVESLAFYTVAFTLANMATMFSFAMLQSLVPAFSQLLAPEKRHQFDDLFARSLKLGIILLLPSLMVLFVIAKPFFTIWAGPDFGRESTGPFYVLLIGLLFNMLAYIPYGSIVAFGRTDLVAKTHWSELVPYAILAAVLINYFGIIGAAVAWSVRLIFDSLIFLWLSKTVVNIRIGFARIIITALLGIVVLAPSPLIAVYNNYSPLLLISAPVSIALYGFVVWRYFVSNGERGWLIQKFPERFREMVSRAS